ncbi:MAG: RND transporter [bacterium]
MKDRFWAFIDGLSPLMFLLLVWLMLAPWPMGPEPHLVEKFGMFREGTLTKPIDIFDVFWHSSSH